VSLTDGADSPGRRPGMSVSAPSGRRRDVQILPRCTSQNFLTIMLSRRISSFFRPTAAPGTLNSVARRGAFRATLRLVLTHRSRKADFSPCEPRTSSAGWSTRIPAMNWPGNGVWTPGQRVCAARSQMDDRTVIHAQRPVTLAGINEIMRRGDLRESCVFLHPPMMLTSRRLTEGEIWSSFHILGNYCHSR
jgi:hypothetical protein